MNEFYEIIPAFNSAGRLCNYHTGDGLPRRSAPRNDGGGEGETAKVPAAEWERFNQLAGRQHEIIDGVVVYNADLEPCLPDDAVRDQIAALRDKLSGSDYKVIKCAECAALGAEMPYDVAELHGVRQGIRDEINRLEASLNDH